ncbi:MAG: alpha/beta hydrolase [Betaproteobacteria bacterium]|nr:MAG: alpha/beta hydrolase [Betaproteobacteria bacterium]
MSSLDPELVAYFQDVAAHFAPLPSDATLPVRRGRYFSVVGLSKASLPSSVTINDVTLDLPCGSVSARLFYGHDDSDESVPTIIFFHGGGWVIGNTDTHTPSCAKLAHDANALVVSVDYPLAPENDWRAITEACWQAACAIANDRPAGAPIAIMGDSAGAHLAQIVALRARDESAFHIALQALIYPCIEPKFDTPSYEQFAMGPGLTRADMQWYWQQFAGNDQGANDYRIAPNRAASLAGLPPTYLVTAGLDPLRDDGRAHGSALKAANVQVTHEEFATLPHGFLRMTKVSRATHDAVTQSNQTIGRLLRQSST